MCFLRKHLQVNHRLLSLMKQINKLLKFTTRKKFSFSKKEETQLRFYVAMVVEQENQWEN